MAQNASIRLHFDEHSVDAGQETGLAFTASTAWALINGADQNGTARSLYLLIGDGDPNDDTAHDAVTHALYYDYTNKKLYIKTAASTWTVVGAQS